MAETEHRPFHETIISVMRCAKNHQEMLIVAEMLVKTKILTNHEAILSAWRAQLTHVGTMCGLFQKAVTSIIEQKREAEAEAQQKHEAEARQIAADDKLGKILSRLREV